MTCLQFSLWECKPQLQPALSACVFSTAIFPIHPENVFIYGGICYHTLPTGSSGGCSRFSACYKQDPLSGRPQAFVPQDYSVSCSPPYEGAVPHRFSPGTASFSLNPFLMWSGHVSTVYQEAYGKLGIQLTYNPPYQSVALGQVLRNDEMLADRPSVFSRGGRQTN